MNEAMVDESGLNVMSDQKRNKWLHDFHSCLFDSNPTLPFVAWFAFIERLQFDWIKH